MPVRASSVERSNLSMSGLTLGRARFTEAGRVSANATEIATGPAIGSLHTTRADQPTADAHDF